MEQVILEKRHLDYRLGRCAIPTWSRAAILIHAICMLIPRGVELQLGTIMIDFPRIFLTVFSLVALNYLLSGAIILRATLADLFMFIHIGIVAFSAVYHEGFGDGLEAAVAAFIDMGLAYFVARVAVRSLQCYRYYVRLALIVVAISAIFSLSEMITGYSIIRAVYHSFFSKVIHVHLTDQRLSLYRAIVAFRHNILFGLYCMTVFALAVRIKPYDLKMGRKLYMICLGLAVLGVFASLSSGPWMALFLCFCCLAYGRIARAIRSRWKLFLLAIGLGLLLFSIVSNRGSSRLIIDSTLSPQSGYIRLGMWKSVWALMRDYWPLGWGWKPGWPRVEWYIWESIDSFYAMLLVRSGIFAVLSIVGFLAYSWYRLSNSAGRRYLSTDEANGWILSTVCLFVVAVTVHIFGNLTSATYFLLGAGQTLFATRQSTPYLRRLRQTPHWSPKVASEITT